MKRWQPSAHLSWSDVVAVAVGAATASALQLTVVDLYTHFAITAPSFAAHTRDISWTSVHTLRLHTGGIAVETWITGADRRLPQPMSQSSQPGGCRAGGHHEGDASACKHQRN